MQHDIVTVCGAAGFIGRHLVRRLKCEGYYVRGVDIEWDQDYVSDADEVIKGDLREPSMARLAVEGAQEVYQLAADMGGAGYIFTGENDASILHNSALINLNVLHQCAAQNVRRVFYSSSACVYPKYNQLDPNNPICSEESAYPAAPDSEYGWEKLFSERLYLAYARNHGVHVRIARFHNVFGPEGPWHGGREKAPAALCRKVAQATDHGEIEIWGDGEQTRSFLLVDDCLDAVRLLMKSDYSTPINIGSEEMITINCLAEMIAEIAGKTLTLRHIDGPLGVRGRTSHNELIRRELHWKPLRSLREGLSLTYPWIAEQVGVKSKLIMAGTSGSGESCPLGLL